MLAYTQTASGKISADVDQLMCRRLETHLWPRLLECIEYEDGLLDPRMDVVEEEIDINKPGTLQTRLEAFYELMKEKQMAHLGQSYVRFTFRDSGGQNRIPRIMSRVLMAAVSVLADYDLECECAEGQRPPQICLKFGCAEKRHVLERIGAWKLPNNTTCLANLRCMADLHHTMKAGAKV
jgi:hypothetical protein